jgi:hypothetical protein
VWCRVSPNKETIDQQLLQEYISNSSVQADFMRVRDTNTPSVCQTLDGTKACLGRLVQRTGTVPRIMFIEGVIDASASAHSIRRRPALPPHPLGGNKAPQNDEARRSCLQSEEIEAQQYDHNGQLNIVFSRMQKLRRNLHVIDLRRMSSHHKIWYTSRYCSTYISSTQA